MNNDENNRIKKYDFNEEEYRNKKSPSSNVSIWPIIIFIVVIAALIIGGVKTITHFASKNNTPKTELTSNKRNTQNSISQETNNKTYKKETSKQGFSSEEKDNKIGDSNENNVDKQNDNNQNNDSNDDMFAQPHTFSSVTDAQNYAKATQSKWLNDGYKTYTVSSDSQGYYTLKFVK